jgi:hypothetical protein
MTNYSDFLDEAKSIGIIYHFTTLESLYKLVQKRDLKDTSLVPFDFLSHNGRISCTRNYCLSASPQSPNIGTENGYTVRISLNGDAISNKYSVKPVKGLNNNDPAVFAKNRTDRIDGDESEEVIIGKSKIYPLKAFVIQVDIVDDGSDPEEKTAIEFVIKQARKNPTLNNIPFHIVNTFSPVKGSLNRKINETLIIEEL